MRCVLGLALFLALYFGSCKLLGRVTREWAIANDARHSQWLGRAEEYRVLKKYHALVAVGAGAVSLLACGLPTLLTRRNSHEEWFS